MWTQTGRCERKRWTHLAPAQLPVSLTRCFSDNDCDACKEAGCGHGDLRPSNVVCKDGAWQVIDLGLARYPGADILWRKWAIAFPYPGFSAASHSPLSDALLSSTAQMSCKPQTVVGELESVLYLASHLHGVLLPWAAEAAAGRRRECCIFRQDLRAAAAAAAAAEAAPSATAAAPVASAAAATAYSQWTAELPPVLKQLAPWVLTRQNASREELLDLQAALQVPFRHALPGACSGTAPHLPLHQTVAC